MKQRKPSLTPAALALAAAALLMAIAAYMATADAAEASERYQNAEKAYYSVDSLSFDSEHALVVYLLAHPSHGDVIQHQCVVVTEDLKFKKCTLSSRHL